MADTISRLAIHVGMNTAALRRGQSEVSGILGGMKQQIATMFVGLTGLSLGGVAGFGVKLAAEMEQASIAFEVMIGDAERAKKLLGELKDFAVATPFEFPELRDAGRTLLAMGIGVEDVMRNIKVLGDISAGTNQPLNELAGVFGQVAVAGRLTGNELRQFNERGIPLMEALAARFGTTKAAIRDMVEGGKISFADVEAAMASMAGEGGRFANLMDRQSQTLGGRFSTLADSAKMAAASFGSALAPALSKLVESLIPLANWFEQLDTSTVQSTIKIAAWAGSIAAAIVIIPRIVTGVVAITTAIQAMAKAQVVTMALTGPKGWAVLAASLAVAGVAAYGLNAAFAENTKSAKAAEKAGKDAGDMTKDAAAAAIPVVDALAESQRKRAEVEKETAKTFEGFFEMQKEASQLKESLMTSPEKIAAEQAAARRLYASGAIDQQTFNRAMAKANEQLREHAEAAREAANERQRLNNIDAPQGLVRGTSGAASAITNFRFNNPQGDALLQQIVDLLRGAPVIRGARLT